MGNLHDITLDTLDGQPADLSRYAGKVMLVVNVASRCGFTRQYAGLQALHASHKDRGLALLGVPCNQFGAQEPGTPKQIAEFCTTKFGVEFDLSAKVDVNGPGRHPLYAHLTSVDTSPQGSGDISWNFEKFVIGRDGAVLARFGPSTAPDDPALLAAIEQALG